MSNRQISIAPRPVESAPGMAASYRVFFAPRISVEPWIAEQIFDFPTQRNEQVYLSITPTILAGIAADYREFRCPRWKPSERPPRVVSSA